MYLLLFVLFLIFCGKVTLEICLIDFFVTTLLYIFIHKTMEYPLSQNLVALLMLPLRIRYAAILVFEIAKANISVIKFIVGFKYEIEPILIHFDSDLKTQGARVLLANSITLTPGTITVSMTGKTYTVHCLDKDLAEGIESSVLVREIKRLDDFEVKLLKRLGRKEA